MLEVHTWITISLISLCIAVILRMIAEKSQKNLIELAAVVLLPVIGSYFSDSETINTRVTVIAISLITYLISTIICHVVVWLIKNRTRSTSIATSDTPKKGIEVILPVEAPFCIDQNFIDNLPADVYSLTHMSNELNTLTLDFKNKFPQLTNDQEREENIRSFFVGICYHILDFFDDSVRVHVRIL